MPRWPSLPRSRPIGRSCCTIAIAIVRPAFVGFCGRSRLTSGLRVKSGAAPAAALTGSATAYATSAGRRPRCGERASGARPQFHGKEVGLARTKPPGYGLVSHHLVGGRMNTSTTAEPPPSGPPAPDARRRATLCLLPAASAAAVLQIPFNAALVPDDAGHGAPLADVAENAAGMVPDRIPDDPIGVRRGPPHRLRDAHAGGLGRRRVPACRGTPVPRDGCGDRGRLRHRVVGLSRLAVAVSAPREREGAGAPDGIPRIAECRRYRGDPLPARLDDRPGVAPDRTDASPPAR